MQGIPAEKIWGEICMFVEFEKTLKSFGCHVSLTHTSVAISGQKAETEMSGH